jgi:hypothetical protein
MKLGKYLSKTKSSQGKVTAYQMTSKLEFQYFHLELMEEEINLNNPVCIVENCQKFSGREVPAPGYYYCSDHYQEMKEKYQNYHLVGHLEEEEMKLKSIFFLIPLMEELKRRKAFGSLFKEEMKRKYEERHALRIKLLEEKIQDMQSRLLHEVLPSLIKDQGVQCFQNSENFIGILQEQDAHWKKYYEEEYDSKQEIERRSEEMTPPEDTLGSKWLDLQEFKIKEEDISRNTFIHLPLNSEAILSLIGRGVIKMRNRKNRKQRIRHLKRLETQDKENKRKLRAYLPPDAEGLVNYIIQEMYNHSPYC